MSIKRLTPERRIVCFISDVLMPWVMVKIKDRELKAQLIEALGNIKQMIYSRGK